MMQHNGIPTRLLDRTYSAYIALFFSALPERVHSDEDDHAAVWAIDQGKLLKRAWDIGEKLRLFVEGSSFDSSLFLQLAFRTHSSRMTERLVIPVVPGFEMSRLSSQQGCFLFNCDVDMAFQESLSQMMQDMSRWVVKLMF